VAAQQEIEKGTAKLHENHDLDHKVQEIRGMVEDFARKAVRLKQEVQETRGELLRLRGGIAKRLKEEISRLEDLKREKK